MKNVLLAALALSTCGALSATPFLRLTNTTVGPVSIAAGTNGTPATLEVFNLGDGTLNLTAKSSSTWLQFSIGALRPCTSQAGNCTPIQINFQTASLAKGTYTAVVTLSDPNAIDAPQTFTVTVSIGGQIPDNVDLFVTPTGTLDKFVFETNSSFDWITTTENQQSWLVLSLDAAGTYTFVFPYRIQGRRLASMGEGNYRGTVAIKNSKFAGDNKTVNVTLHVTSQPIAAASTNAITLRQIRTAGPVPAVITINNIGLGTVAITGVSVVNPSPGFSPTISNDSKNVTVTVNPSSLGPGHYYAQIAVATNAANGTVTVPLDLEVVPTGPPYAIFQGVVNNATFDPEDNPAGQGTIMAVFGEQLSNNGPSSGTQIPLVTKLGGVRVLVNGQPAPLFFSSAGQVNFQLPFETPQGVAVVQVERDGQLSNTVSVTVTDIAPRLLLLGRGDYGLVVNQDGTFPVPTSLGVGGHPAHIGDTLVIYAIGLGATSPAVATGAAAPGVEPLARVTTPMSVIFGNRLLNGIPPVKPLFVGLTPGFVGLYQINVTIPPNTAPLDELPVNVTFGTAGFIGSIMRIAVQP